MMRARPPSPISLSSVPASFAASISTCSSVCRQRSRYALLSIGPTATLVIISSASSCVCTGPPTLTFPWYSGMRPPWKSVNTADPSTPGVLRSCGVRLVQTTVRDRIYFRNGCLIRRRKFLSVGLVSMTGHAPGYPSSTAESELVSDRLIVRGAREHNLKDVSVDLPRDAMIVFTGLSGSGKSSLAFDTIFAEGQRRYVESLSAYARQFLGQMDKPDVDFIDGLSPAVSIDQKAASRNPRSTVGTITEVYDYLRLLYARVGKPHCPVCGRPIARQTPQQIVDRVLELDEGTRFQVLAPVVRGRKGEYTELLRELQVKGFSRARVDGIVVRLDEALTGGGAGLPALKKYEKHTIEVVVDRLSVKESARRRLTDSVETALG